MSFSAIYDILKCNAMFECSVILSAEKTDAKHNTMHTAAHRKIAVLRRAAGATARQIFCRAVYTDLAVCSQCDAVFRKENL